MKNAPYYFLQISFLSLLFYSCNPSEEENGITDLEARNYISAYTQGMVKEDAPIQFRFIEDLTVDMATVQNANTFGSTYWLLEGFH